MPALCIAVLGFCLSSSPAEIISVLVFYGLGLVSGVAARKRSLDLRSRD